MRFHATEPQSVAKCAYDLLHCALQVGEMGNPGRFGPDDVDDAVHLPLAGKRYGDARQPIGILASIGTADKA